MAITPVPRAKSESSGYFTRERVITFNPALYALAEEKGCWYLNDFDPLAGEDGYLAEEDSWDGVHFNTGKYSQWEEIIRTYYNKG